MMHIDVSYTCIDQRGVCASRTWLVLTSSSAQSRSTVGAMCSPLSWRTEGVTEPGTYLSGACRTAVSAALSWFSTADQCAPRSLWSCLNSSPLAWSLFRHFLYPSPPYARARHRRVRASTRLPPRLMVSSCAAGFDRYLAELGRSLAGERIGVWAGWCVSCPHRPAGDPSKLGMKVRLTPTPR
jgi:hypothetical protein